MGKALNTTILTIPLIFFIIGLYFWFIVGTLYIFFISVSAGMLIWIITGFLASSKFEIKIIAGIFRLKLIEEEMRQQDLDILEKGQYLLNVPGEIKSIPFSQIVRRTFAPILASFGILNTLIGQFRIDIGTLFTTDLIPIPQTWGFILYVTASIITCIFTFLWVLDDGNWMYFDKDAHESIKVSRIIKIWVRGIIGITMFFSGLLIFIKYIIDYPGQYIQILIIMVEVVQIIGAVVFPVTLIYFKFIHKYFVSRIRRNLWDLLKLKCEIKINVVHEEIVPIKKEIPEEPELTSEKPEITSEEKEEDSLDFNYFNEDF